MSPTKYSKTQRIYHPDAAAKYKKSHEARHPGINAEYVRAHEARHPGANVKACQKSRKANPIRALYHNNKMRAQRKGRTFELTVDYIEKLLEPMICSRRGHELSWTWDGPGPNPWAPSIDRIDSAKGYTPGNVQLVSWIYNQCKGVWSDDVVAQFLRRID